MLLKHVEHIRSEIKIASDIKLVFHSSTITMMHGQINIRSYFDVQVKGFTYLFSFFIVGACLSSIFSVEQYDGQHRSSQDVLSTVKTSSQVPLEATLFGPVSSSNYLIILLHQRSSLVQYFFLSESLPCDENIIQWNLSYTEPGHTGKLLQSQEFELQALVWKWHCLHRENKITSLWFRYRQVLLYSMQLNFILLAK